ncbi:sensor histidine kinase [Streptosporangium carneum]|uniref:sensor histidine kinase n=1 Tax=Streptosporangium carneum TaxID=47481 RepID=UPI0022F2E6D2|nr:sensor histidine kinase [Streptosporangium carneum]
MGWVDDGLDWGQGPRSRWRKLAWLSIGLVYLFFPAMEVVTGKLRDAQAVWGVPGLVVFVGCYLATALSHSNDEDPSPLTYALLALTTAMAVILSVAFGGGWLTLAIYTTVIYSMVLRPRLAAAGAAVMGVVVLLIGLLRDHDLGSTVVLVLQVFTLAVLFTRVRRTRMLVAQLRQARDEVARLAASEERLRIARDLHDLLGHSLSLIVLKSELAGRLAEGGSERALPEIRDIESVARQALVEVRDAVAGYRQRGLSGELDGARVALEAAGTQVRVRLAGTPLPDDVDGLFGWAVREGVTNVIRHARAARCEIDVRYDGGVGVLEIVDDGCGAVPREQGGGRSRASGNGLTGLTERVEAAGGTVSAGPSEGGFALRVEVPAGRGKV